MKPYLCDYLRDLDAGRFRSYLARLAELTRGVQTIIRPGFIASLHLFRHEFPSLGLGEMRAMAEEAFDDGDEAARASRSRFVPAPGLFDPPPEEAAEVPADPNDLRSRDRRPDWPAEPEEYVPTGPRPRNPETAEFIRQYLANSKRKKGVGEPGQGPAPPA